MNQFVTLGIDLLVIVFMVYLIGVILVLVREDREPTTTLAWLLLMWWAPFVGAFAYFFFGRNWARIVQSSPLTRRMREIAQPFMTEVVYPHYIPDGERFLAEVGDSVQGHLVRTIQRVSDNPVLPARTVHIFERGDEYFDTLLADMAAAERFIHLQYFIWEHDELTARITKVLLDRLAAGVEVKILVDFIGSISHSPAELRQLEKAGARVGRDVREIGRLNYRNHRKIAVIDAEIGHSGGFNIGQEYIDGGKRFASWRDTGIRITGPAVVDLEETFALGWYEVFKDSLFEPSKYPNPDLEHGTYMAQVVTSGVEDYWRSCARTYNLAITGAEKRVWLQSPYWVPDAGTLDSLVNAALGGVDVQLMIAGVPDKKLPFWAAESYFRPLLAAGGRIWRYEAGFFHSKSIVIDGRAAAIGTMNLDMRSLRLNKELVIWCYNASIATRCEEIFVADVASCREITLVEVDSWGSARNMRNSAARLVSNLL